MRKSLILLCAVLLSISSLFSQHLPKTLLWRISGNGLTKPSYIYGTMHVQDSRLFVLGDSLLAAISNSEGFANEVDLNQVTPMIIEMIQQEITNAVYVKTLVSKKEFDYYGPALSRKLNKPAEEITTTDVLRAKNQWISDDLNGKKMQTFLDAYLTGLADRQGKWIGGIEDFADQKGLMNSLVDESDIKQLAFGDQQGESGELDKMTTMYLNADMDGFRLFINGMDSNYKDNLLIRRNHKMSFRMDSLAHTRSTVFAVGAAHLPGEEGLISLLRARGFHVDPVFSSKKIKPEDYPVHDVVRSWVEVNDPDGRYKVWMPGIPGSVNLYGIVSMKLYYNVFNGTMYMTYAMPVPYDKKSLDSAVNSMMKQLFDGGEYRKEKSLEINGISGTAYVQDKKSGYKKVYLLVKGSTMYFAMGFSSSDKESSRQAINRFFDSYQPIYNQPLQNNSNYTYIDSIHAYEVMLPSKPTQMDNLPTPDKNIKGTLSVSIDPETGTYFFCGINQCKRGYVFRDDSLTVQTVRSNLRKKYTNITLDTVYAENNLPVLEMNGSMAKNTTGAKTKIIFRGNRYCTLLIMYTPGKENEKLNKALNSFHLINNREGHWANQTAPDSLFTTWSPAGFLYSDGKDTNQSLPFQHYDTFDSNSVHFYIMTIDTLDTYFWWKTDSAFCNYEKNKFLTSSDTLLSDRIFRKNGMLQYEFSYRPKGANNVARRQIWLRGNMVYRMSTVQEPEAIWNERTNRFFEQLHFNRAAEETHVFDSKAALLLKDLRSADTLISRKANKALPDAPFDVSEIPLLQEAVLITYREDSVVTNSTNGEIAERIIKLNDSSSVAFARKHYQASTDNDVKYALLDLMSARQTRDNYDSLGKLFVAFPPKYAMPGWITGKWRDSLKVTANLFPTVLPLLKDSALAGDIFDLADALLEDSLISINMFRPWQHAILQYADRRFRKTKADTLNYSVSDYSVITVLQQLKTDSCNAMLKRWLGVEDNDYHKQNIVLNLLKNNQPVPASVLLELAADKNTRLDLYRNLKTYKKTSLFPAKYLTQTFFAESVVQDVSYQFDDQESDITFIRIKEIKWKGKMCRFFFYDLFTKGDNEHRLAVAGPYNINKTGISYSEAQSDVYVVVPYDEKDADEQMKALVKQMGEEKED
jgi:uncharacterized protein YbaP (TraB family)